MTLRTHTIGGRGLVASIEGLGTMGMTAMYGTPHQVAALTSTRKILNHPRAGRLDVQCDYVLSTVTGQRLVIFRPQPGSATAEGFDFLRVLGGQEF